MNGPLIDGRRTLLALSFTKRIITSRQDPWKQLSANSRWTIKRFLCRETGKKICFHVANMKPFEPVAWARAEMQTLRISFMIIICLDAGKWTFSRIFFFLASFMMMEFRSALSELRQRQNMWQINNSIPLSISWSLFVWNINLRRDNICNICPGDSYKVFAAPISVYIFQ